MKREERKELNKLCLKIRRSEKYQKWRARVLKRDLKYMAKEINLKSLQVHHETPFREILLKYNIKSVKDAEKCRELWIVKNGATLTQGEHRILSLIERCRYHTKGFFEAMDRLLLEHLNREMKGKKKR